MCNFYPVRPRVCVGVGIEVKLAMNATQQGSTSSTSNPAQTFGAWFFHLEYFCWNTCVTCTPRTPVNITGAVVKVRQFLPTNVVKFVNSFLNSQAKGAAPALSAPPVVCDLALRRCPWFSGILPHFPQVPQVPAALAWAQQAAAARVNEDLARMVGQPRKRLLHGIQFYYTIYQKQQEKRC